MRRTPGENSVFSISSSSAQKVRTGNACRADDRWSGVPGIERDGHTDTATGAARPPGPRTSAVRLRWRPPLGAERLARPTPRLPDRSDRPYGVVQKQGRGIGLLLAPLPHGSQQRFFFLLRPAAPLLLDRAESTDLFVEGHQVLAELLEAVKLGDLLLGFAQGGGIGKGLRHGLAGHAASETELRVMSGVVAFGAVAGRLAAAAHDRGKGAGSQITQTEELLQELGSFGLQSIDIVRHKVSFLYRRLSVRI